MRRIISGAHNLCALPSPRLLLRRIEGLPLAKDLIYAVNLTAAAAAVYLDDLHHHERAHFRSNTLEAIVLLLRNSKFEYSKKIECARWASLTNLLSFSFRSLSLATNWFVHFFESIFWKFFSDSSAHKICWTSLLFSQTIFKSRPYLWPIFAMWQKNLTEVCCKQASFLTEFSRR